MQDYSPSFYFFSHSNVVTDFIGIKYCQKISEKVSLIHIQIQHTISKADTCANAQKVSPTLLVAIPILRY